MNAILPLEFRERANCGVAAIVDISGKASHDIVRDALFALERLDHRGARGAEENTGDGAGILLQKPDDFFRSQIDGLPDTSAYGVGQLFMPKNQANCYREHINALLSGAGFRLLGWRKVPIDEADLGQSALAGEPVIWQMLVAHVNALADNKLDRQLFLLHRQLEKSIRASELPAKDDFYICSLDRQRLVYKGMLTNVQLRNYYSDLRDERMKSAFALVHSRFSTNTLGAWPLAHPHRMLVHNGEINTYRGNLKRLQARAPALSHPDLGDLSVLHPLFEGGKGDTALLDDALAWLMSGGRSLAHALRMLIPEAWEKNPELDASRRDWYDYHATLMEPWDGPALVVATDGVQVAAILDRNGFRPCHYDVTRDGRLILASEAGVLNLDPADIICRKRLGPGEMLLVDPEQGLLEDKAVFARLADPLYGRWLKEQRLDLKTYAPPRENECAESLPDLLSRQRAAGYTLETLERLLRPMAEESKDPLGAMGDDTPPAALSGIGRPVFDYFKQIFAQVSNPPIDYLRESRVTSLTTHIGPQLNLLEETAGHCRRIRLDSPFLSNGELAALRGLSRRGFANITLDLTFDPEQSLESALSTLCLQAEAAATTASLLVLSDRAANAERLMIPSLLALGAVHQHLLKKGLRTGVALLAEISDAFSVHHQCTLLGFGADAINPWLALGSVAALNIEDGIQNYLHAMEDGVLKVMAKMGISTLESYKGSQLFEALGLAKEVVDCCFTGSVTRISGAGFQDLEATLREWHRLAFKRSVPAELILPTAGTFYWRRDGEHHDWNPDSLGLLQAAVRAGDNTLYRAFSKCVDQPENGPSALRGLLQFKTGQKPVALDAVEPLSAITRRFFSGAMSLGALSPEAHETLAIGMNRVGGIAHSGEGGEQEERLGTEKECKNKQIASGRFGVTALYLASAKQIEIKMAQGAKPGEGGELPGIKVQGIIAELRHTTPGVGLISPPPHHDIYSIEDLAQLIHDLRCANPTAEIHVKLVAEAGVGTIAAGVTKAGADSILIAGDSGGTGAATKTSIKGAGIPWELGLVETQRVLIENRLRSRVRLRVDGGLKTGRDVVIAALLGAEEFGFGMGALVTIGCIMLRKCHCNTCSVGIATQDPELRKRFPGKPEHLVNYLNFVAAEVREYLAYLGVTSLDELIGRVELLERLSEAEAVKQTSSNFDIPFSRLNSHSAVDVSLLLDPPPDSDARRKTWTTITRPADKADAVFLEQAEEAIKTATPVTLHARIQNRDRSVGTRLSYEVTRRYGRAGLPPGTLCLRLEGVAGQSLGAFLNRGITLMLSGVANDYVGKGLSGGLLALAPPAAAGYSAANSTMLGNAALYGATSGELYACGTAGQRFAVRNSGAFAVVEGLGDHGCEYMTGGAIVVLGSIGHNFAAGMNGGQAYLLSEAFCESRIDRSQVLIEAVTDEYDQTLLERLLCNHYRLTGSVQANELLNDWPAAVRRFIKVIPHNYAAIVAQQSAAGQDPRPLPPPLAHTEKEVIS